MSLGWRLGSNDLRRWSGCQVIRPNGSWCTASQHALQPSFPRPTHASPHDWLDIYLSNRFPCSAHSSPRHSSLFPPPFQRETFALFPWTSSAAPATASVSIETMPRHPGIAICREPDIQIRPRYDWNSLHCSSGNPLARCRRAINTKV